MSDEIDGRLGRLLRGDSVPERDALFRIRLLERGERRRYLRRTRLQWSVPALLVLLPLVGLVGPHRGDISNIPMSELVRDGLAAAFILALLASTVLSARGVVQAARWLRRG